MSAAAMRGHIIMNKTILVVDDDEVLNHAIARGLRNENFNVVSATSAEDANEILARIREIKHKIG